MFLVRKRAIAHQLVQVGFFRPTNYLSTPHSPYYKPVDVCSIMLSPLFLKPFDRVLIMIIRTILIKFF